MGGISPQPGRGDDLSGFHLVELCETDPDSPSALYTVTGSAARRLARQFGLSMPLAGVVAELAAIGGAHG